MWLIVQMIAFSMLMKNLALICRLGHLCKQFYQKIDVGITSWSLKVKSFWNPANHIKSVRAGGGVPLASSSITCPIKQRHCCNRHGWTLCVADLIVVFKFGFKSLATILGFEVCQTFEPTITNLRVKFVSWCKGIFSAVTFETMV